MQKIKILFGIVCLFLIASISYCQDQPHQRFDKSSPLELTIKSDKQEFKVGDNILVECTMKNLSKEKIKPFYILQESKIVINEKEYDFPLLWRGFVEGTIEPGQEYTYRYVNLKVFEQVNNPGSFIITWKYKNISSNTITIEIVEKDAKQMLNLARSAAKAFCTKFNFPAEKIKLLEGPPLGKPARLKRNGRYVIPYRWLGGGRGGYYVQPEIYLDNGQVIVYGGYSDREFGPWIFKSDIYKKEQPLQLTIKSDKQIYKIDEDITVEVELKNLSDKPVHIATYFRYFSTMGEDSGLRFNIIRPNKQPVQYPDPRRVLFDIMVYPKALSLEKVLSLELNKGVILGTKPNEWYVIDKVGKYEIKAIFRDSLKLINKLADSVDYCKDIKEECIKKGCWEGELTSNTITIEVVGKKEKDISREEAIKLGNDYMKRHYGIIKFLLKYKTKPSEIFEAKDKWIITYAEKEPRTIPSGVVLWIDKKTGEVRFVFLE